MNKSRSKVVAYFGIMSALLFLFLALETFVFGSFLPISPCYLSLPLAISLCLCNDKKSMFTGGLIFGSCSFILAVAFPKFAIFLNPLISILPRVLMGIVAYLIYALVYNLTKKEYISLCFGGFFGAFANTLLVMTALWLFGFSGFESIFATIIGTNAIVEFVCSIILVPIMVKTIKKQIRR